MKLGGIFIGATALALSSAARAADDEPICADRPGKATPTCTVAPGKTQVEVGLVDWSHDRADGASSESLTVGDTAVKFGLTDRLHIEFDLTPFANVRGWLGRFAALPGHAPLEA